MDSAYAIGDASNLFTLPRQAEASTTRTHAGPAYSIVTSRKRKRTEIVVGVDGEVVNIYGIKTSKLVASYPIPPQERLTTLPLSIKCKTSTKLETTRFTYFASRNELPTQRYQIHCVREDVISPSQLNSIAPSSPINNSRDVGSGENKVVLLEALPTQTTLTHDLLVVQEHGQISAYSADLSKEEWITSLVDLTKNAGQPLSDLGGGTGSVVQSFCMSGVEARAGLLQSREDLVALLNPTGELGDEVLERSTVLCIITSPWTENADRIGDYIVNIFAIQPRVPDLSRSPIRFLVQWTLPSTNTPGEQGESLPLFSYNKEAGTLARLEAGSVTMYSFHAIGPRIVSAVTIPKTPIDSFVHLPYDLALVSTKTQYLILNLRHHTIQASAPVNAAESAQLKLRKRKRGGRPNFSIEPAYMLDYYASEGIVVGIQAQSLVGFPIQLPMPPRGRKALTRSRLIDSLGRGIQPMSTNPEVATELATASIVAKLVDIDPSLNNLSQYLIDHEPITFSGTIEAIKYLLRSFNAPRPIPAENTHLLTNGNGTFSSANFESSKALTNGVEPLEDPVESVLALEDAALSADIQLATSFLSDKSPHLRGRALRIALTFLGTSFSSQQVARAMREQLDRRDILFLIELLRVDLDQGGWTSHMLDLWPALSDDEGNEHSGKETNEGKAQDAIITVLSRVLTFAVDALGMGAWLTNSGAENEGLHNELDVDTMDIDSAANPVSATQTKGTYATISALRSEIALVLECAQESAFFANFLCEFLRYEQAVTKPQFRTQAARKVTIGPTLAPKTSSNSILPLGVRAAQGVDAMKIRPGNGEVKQRSKREIGHELSKRVGAYAFERLRI